LLPGRPIPRSTKDETVRILRQRPMDWPAPKFFGGPHSTLRNMAASNRWAFWIIFVVAFGLRAGTLALYPRDVLLPNTSWETGAIAESVVRTGRFADPYVIPTGVTAHAPPAYVFLLALLYWAFGFTLFAGVLHWLLVLASYSVMYAMLPWVADRLGIPRGAGAVGGVAGALLVLWPGEVEGFAGVVLALMAVAFARRWSRPVASDRRSLGMGLAAGASFHLQPALLPVILGWLAFELWWRREPASRRGTAVLFVGMTLACVPWAVRNQVAFGEQFFVRGNLGLELYVGNHPGAHADVDISSRRGTFAHPRTSTVEAERVRELGEREYMHRKGREAIGWIRDEPVAFVRLTAERIAYLWAGPLHDPPMAAVFTVLTLLALVGGRRILPLLGPPQRAALLVPLVAYPLVYYVTAYQARYRDPINWILLMLAGAALWRRVSPPRRGDATGTDRHRPASPAVPLA